MPAKSVYLSTVGIKFLGTF